MELMILSCAANFDAFKRLEDDYLTLAELKKGLTELPGGMAKAIKGRLEATTWTTEELDVFFESQKAPCAWPKICYFPDDDQITRVQFEKFQLMEGWPEQKHALKPYTHG